MFWTKHFLASVALLTSAGAASLPVCNVSEDVAWAVYERPCTDLFYSFASDNRSLVESTQVLQSAGVVRANEQGILCTIFKKVKWATWAGAAGTWTNAITNIANVATSAWTRCDYGTHTIFVDGDILAYKVTQGNGCHSHGSNMVWVQQLTLAQANKHANKIPDAECYVGHDKNGHVLSFVWGTDGNKVSSTYCQQGGDFITCAKT